MFESCLAHLLALMRIHQEHDVSYQCNVASYVKYAPGAYLNVVLHNGVDKNAPGA